MLKRQRERKRAEKAELKRAERAERERAQSGEGSPVASQDDLAGYGLADFDDEGAPESRDRRDS